MEMRKVYCETLGNLMRENDKIVLVDADLARACGTLPLYKEFPDRCIDVGIAESNMCCVAAGLASYGFIPFFESFAPFAVRRTYDQIAVSIAYAKQKVIIVGTDPGVWAGHNGGTHMTFEDVAAMRATPNMVVFEPVDPVQLKLALPVLVSIPNSVYIRMGRKECPVLLDENTYKFDLNKADVLKEGKDVTLVVSGILTPECLQVADELSKDNVSVEVISVHTIKPLDEQTIINSAKKTGRVLTVENANKFGGLYGAVCETLSRNHPTLCDYVAVEDQIGEVGTTSELKQFYGLTPDNIKKKLLNLLKK